MPTSSGRCTAATVPDSNAPATTAAASSRPSCSNTATTHSRAAVSIGPSPRWWLWVTASRASRCAPATSPASARSTARRPSANPSSPPLVPCRAERRCSRRARVAEPLGSSSREGDRQARTARPIWRWGSASAGRLRARDRPRREPPRSRPAGCGSCAPAECTNARLRGSSPAARRATSASLEHAERAVEVTGHRFDWPPARCTPTPRPSSRSVRRRPVRPSPARASPRRRCAPAR